MVNAHWALGFGGYRSGSACYIDTLISLRSKRALGWFHVCIVDTHTLLAGVEGDLCIGTGSARDGYTLLTGDAMILAPRTR